MHWSTERFAALHAVAAAGAGPEFLEGASELKEDLWNLLGAPAKSEASRGILAKRLVTFEGEQYELNSEFLDAAAQVADELNVDELVAAQLVLWSSQDATTLGVTPLDAAVTLWYVRRQYILDLVRFITERAIENSKYEALAREILGADPVSTISSSLRAVEQALDDLVEKGKRAEFMGLSNNAQVAQLLRLQHDFLVKEHEALGTVLFAVVTSGLASADSMLRLLVHVSTISQFNTSVLAYFVPSAVFFSELTPEKIEYVFNTFVASTTADTWKMRWLCCSLQLVVVTRAAELLDSTRIDYETILEQARRAIDGGAIEGLLAFSQDIWTLQQAVAEPATDLRPLVRQRVPAFTSWAKSLDTLVLENIWTTLGRLATQVVTWLADTLKEMRLNEEDMYLALANDGDEGAEGGGPGEDLERWFLFISYLYRGRSEAALEWWEDLSGPLYGFLTWSASCQASFMSATCAEMLASLACGPEASKKVTMFLKENNGDGTAFSLNWAGIYDVLVYYIGALSGGSGEDHPVLDDDTLLVLSSYLRLVREVCAQNADACKFALHPRESAENRSFVRLLFDLLKLQTPLTAAILGAAASFSAVAAPETWPLLESWAFVSGRPRFDEILASVQDALAFTELVESLSKVSTDAIRIDDFARFVLEEVLVWSAKPQVTEGYSRNLELACLGTARALLDRPSVRQFCFERSVAHAVLGLICIGVDAVAELPAEHVQVRTVTAAVELVLALVPDGFDSAVLYNLQVVPHLALFAGTGHPTLALASVRLMGVLEKSPLFRATVNRQSRILSILESVTEAGRIRLDLTRQLQRDEPGFELVKQALLELLATNLAENEGQTTTAHQLLGFETEPLQLGHGVGGVASGTSLLAGICGVLGASLGNMGPTQVDVGDAKICGQCSEILASLVRDSRIRVALLDWLRAQDYLEDILSLEPVVLSPGTLLPSVFADFYTHRALLLEVLAAEVHACARQRLLTHQQRYRKALADLPHRSVLVFLEFLEADPVTDGDVGVVRSTQFACLQAWCQLVPVLVQTVGDDALPFVLESMRKLVPPLEEFARRDTAFCRPLTSLLVLLLERYQSLAGSSRADSSATDRMHALFRAALATVQPSMPFPEIRKDLWVLCYQNVRMAQEPVVLLQDVEKCGDRLVQTACSDALGSPDDSLRLVALVFLQVLASLSRKMKSRFLERILVRYNMLQQIVTSVPSLILESSLVPLKVALGLLLEIGQTRQGAQNLLDSGLIDVLDNLLGRQRLRDQHDSLVVAVQLITAVVLSMGAANTRVLTSARTLLQHHLQLIEAVLRADAAGPEGLGESSVGQVARNLTALLTITDFVAQRDQPNPSPVERLLLKQR